MKYILSEWHRYWRRFFVAGIAVVVLVITAAGCGGSSPPGPKTVVYSFIHDVKVGDYYSACSYYSAEINHKNGGQVGCANSFIQTAVGYMILSGDNIWNYVAVKNNSYKELPNGDVQISLLYKGEPGGVATVHKYPEGWKIKVIA